MDLQELTRLVGYLKSARPQQRFEPDTPEAWLPVLKHITVEDARIVAPELVRAREWIGPSDIEAAVARLRARRLEAAGVDRLWPNADPDRPVEYAAELRAVRGMVSSGRWGPDELEAYHRGEAGTLTGAEAFVTPARGELKRRKMPRALTG